MKTAGSSGKSGGKTLPACLTGILVIAAMAALYISQPLFLRQLDSRIYDALLVARPKVTPSDVPVIIDIDEESLARYGQWPWPRYRMATLLRESVNRGAAAVALDILLSEPDRSSPASIREYLSRDVGATVGFTGLPPGFTDYDELLAGEIKKYPVVLGMYARFEGDSENGAARTAYPTPVPNIVQSKPGDAPFAGRVHEASGATIPLENLHRAAPVGLINMSPDSDGFVRQVPMLAMIEDKTYVSLSLRALMVALGRRNIVSRTGPDGLEALQAGPFTVPVTPEGNFIVPFTGPRNEYRYVSAARVLDGSLPADAFADKILFVGTSAPGLLDIRATPFDRIYPGVEVHAAVLDAILTGRWIAIPAWTPGLQIFCILFAGIAGGLAFSFARPRVYVSTGLALIAVTLAGSWLFFGNGLFVSPLYALLTIMLQGALLLTQRFRQEEKQKNFLRQAFSRYVAPEVVKRIADHQADVFSGEEREVSIMFTDIRGFTSISETLNPRQVVTLLNNYFTPMTALVKENGGTLDKFIGDALMAFWNAPLSVEDHPVRAVATALAMQDKLRLLNKELSRDFGCTITMGAGIHTGKVYVGNMGSEDLINYTLIGDSVNLTSRLEGLCAQFGVPTVVSLATRDYCHNAAPDRFAFVPLATLRVKGRAQPVSVFSAMRLDEQAERGAELEAFQEALSFYTAGNFTEAGTRFSSLAETFPKVKAYAVYADRVNSLIQQPPAQWDGVWTLETR